MLEMMDGMFERQNCEPKADFDHPSSMCHAHAIVKLGLKACETQDWITANQCLGFAFGRIVGLGVFKAEDIKLLRASIGTLGG